MNGELIIDNFAGGGGASLGIELALGRGPDIAINHDREAIAMHLANHPGTKHFCEDVWQVDPLKATGGKPVGLAWFSPDCKHFSKAKGGKPVEKKIRGLAWVAIKWAAKVHPRVIVLENVEEFQEWGPLLRDGTPCPVRKGHTFRRWKRQLENLGYVVDCRELRACDYGAPTIRKRLFIIARRDGRPIIWPEPTHGPGLLPYRTAAECIDWSLPCPSIFERKKPLAEATMRRIAKGMFRYVINAKEPFIVTCNHGKPGFRGQGINEPMKTITASRDAHGLVMPFITEHANASQQRNFSADEPLRTQCAQVKGGHFALVAPQIVGVGGRMGQSRPRSADEPLQTITSKADSALVMPYVLTNTTGHPGAPADEPVRTVTTGGHHALISPTLIQTGYGERPGQSPRVPGLDKPLGTVVAGGQKHAVVAAFLAQHNTQRGDGVNPGRAADDPLSTITTRGTQQQVVAAHMINLKGSDRRMSAADAPAPTVTAGGYHIGEVRAFLVKYYGTDQDPKLREPLHTVTTKDRFGLVTVQGEDYIIADIGMRMLQPRELYRAQGFPDSYRIDIDLNGKPLTKTAQVRMCGNSVCPPIAKAIVEANMLEERQEVAA